MGVCRPEQLQYIGVNQWRNSGFTGRGINVWNIEGRTGDHGANSRQMILDIAPDVNMFTGSIHTTTKGSAMLSCNVADDQSGSSISVEEFLAAYNIDLISSSLKGTRNIEFDAMMKTLFNKYNLCIFNCAYNNGEGDGETIETRFHPEICIIMGALTWSNGAPQRAYYSSVGKELDFAQLVMWWSGTSAATPVQTGMAAMIMQRYGHMSQTELYKYLQMISKDLQATGHDIYTGWGHPILPDISKKYITMTTVSNKYFVDGEIFIMDTKPVNKDGTVFVPVRAISESLGKTVSASFNSDKTIKGLITDTKNTIELNTQSDVMFVNGKKIYLNYPPYIDENNRTLVPIRAIAEAFGCKVDWVQKETKVMILE